MRRAMLALVLLCGCDDEGDGGPATCVDWLRCYDLCGPWNNTSDLSGGIARCDQQCRTELDYFADEPSPIPDPVVLGNFWEQIVGSEQQLAADDLISDPSIDVGFLFRKRHSCLQQGE